LVVTPHNHLQSFETNNILEAHYTSKMFAINTGAPNTRIVLNVVKNLVADGVAQLFNKSGLVRNLQRAKLSNLTLFNAVLDDIPACYKIILKGESFIQFDSGPSSENEY
jgi:hypothetical protein